MATLLANTGPAFIGDVRAGDRTLGVSGILMVRREVFRPDEGGSVD